MELYWEPLGNSSSPWDKSRTFWVGLAAPEVGGAAIRAQSEDFSLSGSKGLASGTWPQPLRRSRNRSSSSPSLGLPLDPELLSNAIGSGRERSLSTMLEESVRHLGALEGKGVRKFPESHTYTFHVFAHAGR